MKRVIGGLMAAMATAALWGCDAVRTIIQAALPTSAQATAAPQTATATAMPVPEITPVDSGVTYSPEPWQPPGGTVSICPDQCPDTTPQPTLSPTPEPTPTPVIRPLWRTYFSGNFAYNKFPEDAQELYSWEPNGVRILRQQYTGNDGEIPENWGMYMWDPCRDKPTGMARDIEADEVVYEFPCLDPSAYPELQTAGYAPIASVWEKQHGPYDAGYSGTFVERDGKLVFHRPGPVRTMSISGKEYPIYSIAGYKGLSAHLNGAKNPVWDFSRVKTEGILVPPTGVFAGVEISLAKQLWNDFYVSDPVGESLRLAYDEKEGTLFVASSVGRASTWAPRVWWGAVRGNKLVVDYPADLWYLHGYTSEIFTWVLHKGTFHAVFSRRGYGGTGDYIAKGTIRGTEAGVGSSSEVVALRIARFPLEYVIDPPPKPDWINKYW